MIRMEYYIRRDPSLDFEKFHALWQKTFKQTAKRLGETLACSKMVAVLGGPHDLNAPMNLARGGAMEPPYDLVLELWWETEDDLISVFAQPIALEELRNWVKSGAEWMHAQASPAWVAMEFPQVNPSPEDVIADEDSPWKKIQFPLRHRADWTESEVRQYWLQNHGPIIRRNAPHSGIVRYLQVHRLNHTLNESLQGALGFTVPVYLGHAEVWSGASVASPEQRRAASQAAVDDESKFIDFSASTLFVGVEEGLL